MVLSWKPLTQKEAEMKDIKRNEEKILRERGRQTTRFGIMSIVKCGQMLNKVKFNS